jgi:outer membrane protein TolC
MKNYLLGILLLLISTWTMAQNRGYYSHIFRDAKPPATVPGPSGLENYVVEGKLRLRLEDVVLLMLQNNSSVNVDRSQYDLAGFGVERAHGPFDPLLNASFQPTRSTSPSNSALAGAATASSLNQFTNIALSREFETGATVGIGLNATRLSTNSSFALVNPSVSSGLNFSISQPLWRKAGLFVNRAPILLAQRNVHQSRANFKSQLNDAINNAIGKYWDVVEAQKSLEVLKKAQELAEATYKQNKRALELGALAPLEIYRSESQVAQKKLAAIQGEYRVKEAVDALRQTIGADLDPRFEALDLDLIESVDVNGNLAPIDLGQTMAEALKNRPEFEAERQQLASDDIQVRLANNSLKPELDLSANYVSNGLGGVVIDRSSGVPVIVSHGGFGDSLSQLEGFNFPTYSMTLQLHFPLRNSAGAADLGTALVSKRRDLYQNRQTEQTVGLEVKNAVHQLEQAELVIAAAQNEHDLAVKTLAADERKYQLGAETIFFVLDSQNLLSQAEQDVVQSLISYRRALAAVDHATGAALQKYNLGITP